MRDREISPSEPMKIAPPLTAFAGFLICWYSITFSGISPLILPPPHLIVSVALQNLPHLLESVGYTIWVAVSGFVLGSGAAVFMAVIFHFFALLRSAIFPYVIGFRVIPLIALAPLVSIWFGTGLLSHTLLAAFIVFFPVLMNMSLGLHSVSSELLAIFRCARATRFQMFWKLELPTALPHLFTGMKVSSTFALIGAIVAEFVGSEKGIGYVIKSSSYYLQTELTFAAIFLAAAAGLILYGGIVLLERKVLFWHKEPV